MAIQSHLKVVKKSYIHRDNIYCESISKKKCACTTNMKMAKKPENTQKSLRKSHMCLLGAVEKKPGLLPQNQIKMQKKKKKMAKKGREKSPASMEERKKNIQS